MSILLSFLGLSLVGSVSFIAANLAHAPEGYQDEDGFHFEETTTCEPHTACQIPAEAMMR